LPAFFWWELVFDESCAQLTVFWCTICLLNIVSFDIYIMFRPGPTDMWLFLGNFFICFFCEFNDFWLFFVPAAGNLGLDQKWIVVERLLSVLVIGSWVRKCQKSCGDQFIRN
jgi:hypothetical protein